MLFRQWSFMCTSRFRIRLGGNVLLDRVPVAGSGTDEIPKTLREGRLAKLREELVEALPWSRLRRARRTSQAGPQIPQGRISIDL